MFNQATLIGHLGGDPEQRKLKSGQNVTSFRMATSRRYVKADGDVGEKTVWFRVSCWGKLGDSVVAALHKGSRVLVQGEIEEAQAYQNASGELVASNEINASTVLFLDRKPKGDADPEEMPF